MRARPMRWGSVAAALAVALAVGVGAAAQTGDREIWDGVYTAAQAARGRSQYEMSCGRCHNDALTGSERGPALTGAGFWATWENDTLDRLFTKIRDTMPAGGIETVSDAGKADILAYLLQANEVPAGGEELGIDPQRLRAVAVTRKGAAAADAPNFALVHVVGCLTRGAGETWMLTHASQPAVTRRERATADDLATAGRQPAGDQSFRLVSVLASYDAARLAGRRVEARGLIFRRPGDQRLNLTSMQMVGAGCETP